MDKKNHTYAFAYLDEKDFRSSVDDLITLIAEIEKIFEVEKLYISSMSHNAKSSRIYKYNKTRLFKLLDDEGVSFISMTDTNKDEFSFELDIDINLDPTLDKEDHVPQRISVCKNYHQGDLENMKEFFKVCSQYSSVLHGGAGTAPDADMARSEVSLVTYSNKQPEEFVSRIQGLSREGYMLWKKSRGIYPVTVLGDKFKGDFTNLKTEYISDGLRYYSSETLV